MSPDFSFPKPPEREGQAVPPVERNREVIVPVERVKENEPSLEPVKQEQFPQSAPQPQFPQQTQPIIEETQEQRELKEVERILEEHVQELFIRLPENKRLAFKQKGEETAKKITLLMHQATVKVQKIISLIMSWLRMAPGVNKFYIEQEAISKANRLLGMKDNRETKL